MSESRIYSPGEGRNIKRDGNDHNDFTNTIMRTKETLMHGNAIDQVKETTKTLQSVTGTPMVQPTGILTSSETTLSGKRYADRPEGIDQFGGEEFERDVYDGDASKGTSAFLRQYTDQPGALDQFGGEGIEREVIEIREGETKPSHTIRVQKWPQGADELGGLEDRNDTP